MKLQALVQLVNDYLAGETKTYAQLKPHLDAVIDDVNNKLNALFPTFTELSAANAFADEYTCFPDKYIRSIVAVGAAFYFFMVDEEGADAAPAYQMMYHKNLFLMERDYINQVPTEYQAEDQGYVTTEAKYGIPTFIDEMF